MSTSSKIIVFSLIAFFLGLGVHYVSMYSTVKTQTTTETMTEILQESNPDYESTCMGGYFSVIDEWSDMRGTYHLCYAKDTKVKYLVVERAYGVSVSPLYNADGTLQIYEEASKQ